MSEHFFIRQSRNADKCEAYASGLYICWSPPQEKKGSSHPLALPSITLYSFWVHLMQHLMPVTSQVPYLCFFSDWAWMSLSKLCECEFWFLGKRYISSPRLLYRGKKEEKFGEEEIKYGLQKVSFVSIFFLLSKPRYFTSVKENPGYEREKQESWVIHCAVAFSSWTIFGCYLSAACWCVF